MALNRARGLQVIDPFLSGVARRYTPSGFIADRLLPAVPVGKLSGQYPIFTKSFWFANDVDNKIVDRAPAKEVDFEWSLDTFLCEEYALKVSITDLERDQAENELRLESNKTEFLMLRMALAREIRAAALLETTGNGGQITNANTTTPGTNWDQDTATIEADIKGAVLGIYDATGQVPNVIVIPYKVAYAMAIQEDIRNILRYDAAGSERNFIQLGNRVLPSVIHGMQVIIPQGAQKNTAREGAAESISEIWGDEVRLLQVNPGAGWGTPTVGYRLVHTAPTVTRWRNNDPDIDYIRAMERVDEKLVAPDVAWILRDVLS